MFNRYTCENVWMQSFLWLFELIIPDFPIIISAELTFWTFAFQRNICHAIQSVMCKILDSHNKLISDIFLTNIFVPWLYHMAERKYTLLFVRSNSSSSNVSVVVILTPICNNILAAPSFYTHWRGHLWQEEKWEAKKWFCLSRALFHLSIVAAEMRQECQKNGCLLLQNTDMTILFETGNKTHFPLVSMCSQVCE